MGEAVILRRTQRIASPRRDLGIRAGGGGGFPRSDDDDFGSTDPVYRVQRGPQLFDFGEKNKVGNLATRARRRWGVGGGVALGRSAGLGTQTC